MNKSDITKAEKLINYIECEARPTRQITAQLKAMKRVVEFAKQLTASGEVIPAKWIAGESMQLDGDRKTTVELYDRAFNVIWKNKDRNTVVSLSREGAVATAMLLTRALNRQGAFSPKTKNNP